MKLFKIFLTLFIISLIVKFINWTSIFGHSIRDEWIFVSITFMLLAFISLIKSTDVIKDLSNTNTKEKPFSFSRTQLYFWSFIIIAGILIVWSFKFTFPEFNQTAIILLGISSATAATSSIIDSNDAAKLNKGRHQNLTSEGFFKDILSDQNGISIHRLQAVIFNLVLGIKYIEFILTQYTLPDFTPTEYTLLGLSAGTYTFLKSNENNTTTEPDLIPKNVPQP